VALEQLGNRSGAIEKLEYALNLLPTNNNVFIPLINALMSQKQYNEAWKVVKKAKKARIEISANLLTRLAKISPNSIQ